LTIDWTPKLASTRGFRAIAFDDLPNGYSNTGEEQRGYLLKNLGRRSGKNEPKAFDENAIIEGEIAYRCNPQRQFNDFSDKAHQIFETFSIYASSAKAEALGDKVEVNFGKSTLLFDVVADERMKGDIISIPDFKSANDIYTLFGSDRYKTVTIRKV